VAGQHSIDCADATASGRFDSCSRRNSCCQHTNSTPVSCSQPGLTKQSIGVCIILALFRKNLLYPLPYIIMVIDEVDPALHLHLKVLYHSKQNSKHTTKSTKSQHATSASPSPSSLCSRPKTMSCSSSFITAPSNSNPSIS
jgi:hypothetical protein